MRINHNLKDARFLSGRRMSQRSGQATWYSGFGHYPVATTYELKIIDECCVSIAPMDSREASRRTEHIRAIGQPLFVIRRRHPGISECAFCAVRYSCGNPDSSISPVGVLIHIHICRQLTKGTDLLFSSPYRSEFKHTEFSGHQK